MKFTYREMAHRPRSESHSRRDTELPSGEVVTSSLSAHVLHIRSPQMRDMIQMGMTTVITDSSRMKREIAPALIYPTLREGRTAPIGIVRQGDFR
ncbi:MAG: hypothetical protein ACXW5W_07525 [Candidatus Binatia bacterium]